nr:hemagglutinin repeat-containing protein [Jejubacter calystegiae]
MQLVSRGDVTNSGTISGREMTQISADNLTNQGFVQGKSVTVLTDNDIINSGGTLLAQDSLTLQAGHDIISRTEGGSAGTEAWLDRSAGIYVQNDKGELTLKAMNDITLTASELINRGQESTTQIIAGRDLNLDTQRLSHATDYTRDSKRYDRTLSTQEAGSRIDAGGVLAIAAGRDINARAAEISAGDALTAQAGRDINLTSGEATYDHEGRSKWTSSGFLSKTKHELYGNTSQREAQSTTVSGDSVQMQAGRDLTVQGSNVVGTGDVSLAAGNNLTLTTVEEAQHDTLVKQKKKSGLMSTGGIGFTVGSLSQKVSTESDSNIQKGSTVGSSGGNVSLSAGNLASIHGSDVVAGQDISITGRDVAITAAQNSHTELTKTETKSSGLRLALSGSVGSALNTATEQARSAKKEDDGRLAALKGTQAALTGYQAAQAGRLAAVSDDKKDGNTVGVMLSYGSQKSTSESRLEQRTSSGSTLTAGRDMTIRATGDGNGQGGDLVVQGSQLTAGRDMALAANRDISLSSGQNSEQLSGSNKSSGGSVGVGIAVGSGSAGFTVSASVNQSRGSEKGNGLTHTETTVDAGRQVSLSSGRDTLLQGAQVSGESIKAEVGRNLTMRSEQDSDRYDMKQSSSSAGASVTWGAGASGSASVSASRDKMHSNFDSVQEQTGLFAGKGGFDVTVGEHTQLDGAVIASTAAPENNRLDTGTLGWSDIHNQADYKVEHQSAGLSTGGSVGDQFLGNAASSLLVGMNGEGHDSSTTHAAVEAGTITIRDKDKQAQDVAGLSRDTEHAANGLSPIFDKEKEQQRLQEAQLIGEIGRQVGDIATTEGTIAGMKAKKDPAALAEAKAQLEREGKPFSDKDVAERAYNNAMQQFGTGSALQQGIQAATAAVQGLAGGNLAQAISGASAPYLAEQIHKLAPDEASRAMAHAVVGAVTSWAAGNNAAAGAAGAVTGEAMAQLVMAQLYPGKKVSELTETEKQTISTLGTLAAGLAGGLAGNSTADAVSGAQAGKNSADNNFLHAEQIDDFAAKAKGCEARGDCKQIVKEMEDLSLKQRNELIATCASDAAACKEKYGDIPANSMLVHEAIDRALGEDIPWEMKNDLSVLLMQQMDESGIVTSTDFAQRLEKQYGLDSQRAEILAGAAMAAVTGGLGKGGKPAAGTAGKNIVIVDSGKKGAWNKALNKPEPNTVYKVDGNKTYNIDAEGRTGSAEATLAWTKNDRNTYQQCKAGKCGNSGDEGGHLIASIFNGPGEKINLLPMDGNLNKSAWKQMENTWANALKDGKLVNVKIEPSYTGSNKRPDSFTVTYQIGNDRPVREVFNNAPGGK